MNKFYSLFLIIIFSFGCSDTILLPKKEASVNISSKGDFCTQPPDKTDRYTKFMFMIDKSGSNVEGNLGGPGTDPNNIKRADNVEKFWKTKKDLPFVKWSMIVFHDWEANSYIGTDANPLFSANPADMQKALQLLRTNPDQHSTPYQAALTMAAQAIKDDKKNNPKEDSDYMIFFISDGYPDDGNVTHPVSDAEIAMVDALIRIDKEKIHLSTAYYGPTDAVEAANGLKKMSEHGNGRFVNLNTANEFNIDELVVSGPSSETYFIKPGSFIVYNANSAICFKGTIGMDSDGDGLCDADEKKLGSPYNVQNRFSFNDGYSDYFHYAAQIAHETLIPCTNRTDEDNDLLTVCEEAFMKNSNPTGTTLFSADPKNPDTDLDGIIDGIEYFMLHLKSAPLDDVSVFKNYDTENKSAGEQIRQHRNPLVPDGALIGEDIYDTQIEFTGYNESGQSCYKFNQNYLKTFPTLAVDGAGALNDQFTHAANGNVVLVSFIQTLQKDPGAPGIYVHSIQTLDGTKSSAARGTSAGLVINDKTFKQYKVPLLP